MSESLLILLFVSLAGQASGTPPPASTKPRPDADCSSQQRVEYAEPRRDWPGRLVVESRTGAEARPPAGQLHRSPHQTASYRLRKPDTSKPGPWTTVVDVFGNEARPIRRRIRAIDHASCDVRVQWLNEQLLWLQVPRGRIVTLDAVLDVDTGRFVYERDALDGWQPRRALNPTVRCTDVPVSKLRLKISMSLDGFVFARR